MINTPQIFIIYEPGMYGTFLCNIFMYHNFLSNNNLTREFESDNNGFNAHKAEYKDRLKKFHTHAHLIELLKKNKDELSVFFEPLEVHNLSIHRLSSYFFTKIDYKNFFTNFVRILILPEENRIDNYAKRMFLTTNKTYETEYWIKNLKNKDLKTIPNFFLEKMSIKEKKKYLKEHMDIVLKDYKIDQTHDLILNPDDIRNKNDLTKLINDTCKILNIEKFELPYNQIKNFLDKNKQFF